MNSKSISITGFSFIKNAILYEYIGLAKEKLWDTSGARDAFQKAGATSISATFKRGEMAYRAGDFTEAKKHFELFRMRSKKAWGIAHMYEMQVAESV